MIRKWLLFVTLLGLCLSNLSANAQEATEVKAADLADPDGKFTEINGAQVYYIERGPQDGPVVLLLHGFLGSTINWDNVIDPLVKAGYRTVAFDRPPFGLSDKNPKLDYSLEAMAKLTAGLMDTLKIEKAALVGHSAGGPVIARFALLYRERVEKLVFVAGAIGITAADMGGQAQNGDNAGGPPFANFGSTDPNSPIAQFAVRTFMTSFAPQLLKQAFYDPSKIPPGTLERNARALKIKGWEAGLLAFTRDSSDQTSVLKLDNLRTIQAPTLLIWGENDAIVPINVGQRLRKLLPNATWITYPKVGHVPQDENTAAFNQDLIVFLGKE